MRETSNLTFPKTEYTKPEKHSIKKKNNYTHHTKLVLCSAVVLHGENVCLFGNCPSENLGFHSPLQNEMRKASLHFGLSFWEDKKMEHNKMFHTNLMLILIVNQLEDNKRT